jgi:hypothetical protein
VTRPAHPGAVSLLSALSVALLGVLLVSGCGGSSGTATAPATPPSMLGHDAITAPPVTELASGMTVQIRPSTLRTVGWQVACSSHGRRVTAEAVRGQRTGSGEVTGFKGGSPSIWISHNRDGSITVSCH